MSTQELIASIDNGLETLNTYLVSNSYISGYAPSKQDLLVLAALPADFDTKKYASVARWYIHISSFPYNVRQAFPETGDVQAEESSSSSSSSSSGSSSGSSSSGSDSDEEELTEEQKKEKAELEEKKRKYAEKIARNIAKEQSNVIIDVKPEDTDVDLEGLWEKIKQISCEGLLWAQTFQILPIAFGLKKIRIASTITNVLVSTDWMQDEIEAIEGVASTEIVAFQKI